jgi:hypothetical protein
MHFFLPLNPRTHVHSACCRCRTVSSRLFPAKVLLPSKDEAIQRNREVLIKLTRQLYVTSYEFVRSLISTVADLQHALCICSHCTKLTPAKARLYPEIWHTACEGICAKIEGYRELIRDDNKKAAEDIYTSASACNNSLSFEWNMLVVLNCCAYVVLDTVWDNTRRMLKEQGIIPKTCDSVKAEKFRATFSSTRPQHKNYRIKSEVLDQSKVCINFDAA